MCYYKEVRKKLKHHFIPYKGNNYKPNSVRKESLIVTLIFGLFSVIMAVVGSHSVPHSSLLAQVQASLLTQFTNENRSDRQIQSLSVNPLLEKAARLKAQDMIENNYFSHVSPDGVDPWHWFDEAGYSYKHAGENLASDFYDTRNVTNAWMNSPLHKRNILNPKYTEIGVAIETGIHQGRRVALVVQMFGSPRYPSENPTLLAVNESAPEINNDTPFIQTTPIPQVLGQETTRSDVQEVTMVQTSLETVFEPTEEEKLANSRSLAMAAPETQPKDYNFLITFLAQPGLVGQLALGSLIIILTISLILKITIEFKKTHYKNVVGASIVLAVLIILYGILSLQMSQVVII